MTELSKAFENILPKTVVTGLSGATSLYESKGGKAKKSKKAKKASKKSKKASKKTAKKSRKWFPLLGF